MTCVSECRKKPLLLLVLHSEDEYFAWFHTSSKFWGSCLPQKMHPDETLNWLILAESSRWSILRKRLCEPCCTASSRQQTFNIYAQFWHVFIFFSSYTCCVCALSFKEASTVIFCFKCVQRCYCYHYYLPSSRFTRHMLLSYESAHIFFLASEKRETEWEAGSQHQRGQLSFLKTQRKWKNKDAFFKDWYSRVEEW